jgi:hypothetical protein
VNAAPNDATHNETFFELAQWLARVQQYSANHPACAQLGERTQRALTRSLALEAPLSVDVAKDGMSIGGAQVAHAAVRTRLAPHLHERGVLVLRFFPGTSVEELTALIELFTLPVQSTFDRGGLRALIHERGVARIQVEEIAHEISADERAAQRKRERLRSRFADELRKLLARRSIRGLTGEELLELLDHPDLAVAILEEDPLGIAEALAGLCLMVREEEQTTGEVLYPKLRVIILMLSPPSHDRALLGLPQLVGDFRSALVWGFDGLAEAELARIVLASLRAHASSIDVTLYALSVAAPHDGRRMTTLRRVSLYFYDLPADDLSATELITVCALDAGEIDSYARERDTLSSHAMRALNRRSSFGKQSVPPEAMAATPGGRDYVGDARRLMAELVKMAARTRRFEQLCAKLPSAALTLARAGSKESVMGMVDGLRTVTRPEQVELVRETLRNVLSPAVAGHLLEGVDADTEEIEGPALDELVVTVRLLTAYAPAVVLEQLEMSESRKMRRIFIEALTAAGPKLLPLVRKKLHAGSWFVVRNAIVVMSRIGATTTELLPVVAHRNEKVRLEVLRALRTMQPDMQMMDYVTTYLTDPVQEIRQHSVVLLRGDLLSEAGVNRLERIALDESQPEELRRRVVEALGKCPLDAAATSLFTLLQPRGLIELGSLRDNAAVALRGSPAPLAAGYFREGLASPAWRVRKACERAAGGAQ